MSQVNVTSLEPIREFRTALGQFCGETQQTLDTINRQIRRFQEWLEERKRHWRQQIEDCQEAVYQAQRALEACLGDEDANCGCEEDELYAARRALREAEDELANVRHWRRVIEEAILNYQRQAMRMTQHIQQDIPKAGVFLGRKLASIDAYQAESPESGDVIPMSSDGAFPAISSISTPTNTTISVARDRQRKRIIVPLEVRQQILRGFKEGEKYGGFMMQGKAGEMVALLSGDRFSLDEIAEQLEGATEGNHFKIYDNIGKNSVGSVKVRATGSAVLPQSGKLNYMQDFYLAIGQDENHAERLESAAELLLEVKQKQLLPIPENMQLVNTVAEMKAYLRQYGELHIPDNHVQDVQAAIREQIRAFPENFGLIGKATETECERLVQRVKPIGVTSDIIGQMLHAYIAKRRINR